MAATLPHLRWGDGAMESLGGQSGDVLACGLAVRDATPDTNWHKVQTDMATT